MKTILATLFIFIFLPLVFSQDQQIFVSLEGSDNNPGTEVLPFRTIQHAINVGTELEQSRILIKEGTYQIDSALVFLPSNSMSAYRLSIENYLNDDVIISGGKKVEGWKKQRNGIWVCVIPGVKEGKWNFKQIYVNGQLRHRARKPNSGFLRVAGMPDGTPNTVGYHTDSKRFEFAEGDIQNDWKNLEDVEVVVYHFWTDSHLPIESVNAVSNIVTFRNKAGKVFTDDFSEVGARYIVENVFEELDTAGEWYLDRNSGKCYYYPFPDEKLEDVEIYAPYADQLIRFEGDPVNGNFISNVHIRDLKFCYTNWQLPPGNSNDLQGSASVPAAISLKGLKNCSFESCSFNNIGTWAFELNEGCTNNLFAYNEIGNIGAGGFRINGGDYDEHPFLRTSNNTLLQNHIHHYGEVYPSAVGVLIQKSEGNVVSQNLIHHGYYTGISIGWEWGYQRSISRDNIIEFNHIHHIGQGLLSDMGAIYTLGVSPGTVIRNNLIHDVDANHYGGWGIYHDEGSTHILDENNVVYNTKFAGFNMHFAKEVTVRNNIFALGRLQQLNRTRSEQHKSVYFEQNIVYWKEGVLLDGKWGDEEYEFYYHPKDESGTRITSGTYDIDFNLYFNPDEALDSLTWDRKGWDEWKASGKDVHSLYADPLFKDPDNFNFELEENSPAFQLGFRPIDLSIVKNAGKRAGPNMPRD